MKFLLVLVTFLLSSTTSAATVYQTNSIMLLQPEFVLEERVPSIQLFSDYIKKVEAAAENALTGEERHPASGYLVLAVRPGEQSMVWMDFKTKVPETISNKLRSAILAVPAFEVQGGVVVFALNSSLWDSPAAKGFPSPEEWSMAMEGRTESMEIGELVDKVWPGKTGT